MSSPAKEERGSLGLFRKKSSDTRKNGDVVGGGGGNHSGGVGGGGEQQPAEAPAAAAAPPGRRRQTIQFTSSATNRVSSRLLHWVDFLVVVGILSILGL